MATKSLKSDQDVEAGDMSFEALVSPVANIQVKPQDSASIIMMVVLALPRMAISMAWAAQWAAWGPYLGTMLPKFAVQLTQIISPVTGILAGSTIGMLSDRCTSRWGRRRPFILCAALATIMCWIFMAFTREIGEALGDYGSGKKGEKTSRKYTAVLTIFFYAWMDIAVNVIQTPTFLLMADFAGDRQTTGAAIGQGLSTLGAISISVYIQAFGPAHNSLGYFLSMLSVVMLVAVTVLCVVIKEEPLKRESIEKEYTCKVMGQALYSIVGGVIQLPSQLLVFYVIYFFMTYGNISYSGNKGQFFGMEVFGGEPENADTCGNECTPEQRDFNNGVQVAGGSTDIMYNVLGYSYSWLLPFLVAKFGAKRVLACSQIPQALLVIMAFSKVVWFDVMVVVLMAISNTTMSALIVPVIINVFGNKVDGIGMYIGAINSGNCMGQLVLFAFGTVLVDTSLGYKLPLCLGGIMTIFGFLVTTIFFKIKMYSM